ncbi:hypothetical protein ABT369_26835 [Dactylosporangium sp. NPDC000244]|uniref:hypothetical protein n=1 Tax=Dactylosporangium sp. NPDC000244 TaxID=3154365 RepID=UPI003320B54E
MRRLALAVCALIIGAGFTPALPSTVEPARPAPVSLNATAPAAPESESTVDEARPVVPLAHAEPVLADGSSPLLTGRHVGAVAGRAPPAHPA